MKDITPKRLIEIENYYLGCPSVNLKQVAEKFDLSYRTLRDYSSKYNWGKEKIKRFGKLRQNRPSSYLTVYDEKLIDFMAKGYSFWAFAGELGVAGETINRWRKNYDTFREAYKKGKAKQGKFYESIGLLGMTGKIKGFNATVWIHSVKNNFKWTDKIATEQKIRNINSKPLSEKSARELLNDIKEGRKSDEEYYRKRLGLNNSNNFVTVNN